MDIIDIRTGKLFVACCENPTCGKFNPAILKLEDGHCDNCGRDCRNCPPSVGTPYKEMELKDRMEAIR